MQANKEKSNRRLTIYAYTLVLVQMILKTFKLMSPAAAVVLLLPQYLFSPKYRLRQLPSVNIRNQPNHPDVKEVPALKRRTQAVRFQKKWFDSYRWLHYQPLLQGISCWTCIKAEGMGLLRSNSKKDPAFLSKDFRNWKKATKTFEGHQVSDTHCTAAVKLQALRAPSVCVVIDEGLRKRQEAARH